MTALPLVAAALAAVAMEPLVAAVHRGIMHGPGWVLHRSHHRSRGRRVEANDLYPLAFALATVVAMGAGAAVGGLAPLLWAGTGVTAYGLSYLVVHDLFIHERLGRLPGAGTRYVRWVAAAHAVHHRTGGAPYGFLFPRVPAAPSPAVTDACHPASRPVAGSSPPK